MRGHEKRKNEQSTPSINVGPLVYNRCFFAVDLGFEATARGFVLRQLEKPVFLMTRKQTAREGHSYTVPPQASLSSRLLPSHQKHRLFRLSEDKTSNVSLETEVDYEKAAFIHERSNISRMRALSDFSFLMSAPPTKSVLLESEPHPDLEYGERLEREQHFCFASPASRERRHTGAHSLAFYQF